MGNVGSAGGANARRRSDSDDRLNSPHSAPLSPPPHPVAPPPEASANRYVFAAASPYPPQYPNSVSNAPQFYQIPGYYQHPPPPTVMPATFDHHHHHRISGAHGYPYGHVPPPPPSVAQPPAFEHQKAVTIKNDVNIKKETLRMVPDEDNPGRFLVAFTFDATVDGSITVLFFAKEDLGCDLTPMKENLLQPITVAFKEGLSQKFQQPSGTGIDFSMFAESELTKEGEMAVYSLAVKAQGSPVDKQETTNGESQKKGAPNSQITLALFEKKENEYRVRVVKQILWVNGTRYELQEIYGIGNSVDGDFDGSDPGKECVVCLSNPRDTTVLPCRHMCMCTQCAQVLRFQSNRCPICRQPVERLLEIRVHNNNSSNMAEEQMREEERAAAASTGGSSHLPNDETKSL